MLVNRRRAQGDGECKDRGSRCLPLEASEYIVDCAGDSDNIVDLEQLGDDRLLCGGAR